MTILTYCWEGSYPVLKKVFVDKTLCAVTGLGLNSQISLDTCLPVMVQESIPSHCIFSYLLLLLLPTRLPHPWDSPDKNIGVGCHFLLQCTKVKSDSEVTQSCLTLCDPLDCSLPGSSIHGIFQARVLQWGAIAFSTFHT